MVGIIDYGVGNLFSLESSFRAIGERILVSSEPDALNTCDRLILPGVGAFADAAGKLRQTGLDGYVVQQAQKGTPLMGICLGMQLLFEKSFEYGQTPGLGLLTGTVVPMAGRLPEGLKIPHMGWNRLHKTKDSRLLQNTPEGTYVYFVHSYFAQSCEQALVASTHYGISMTAAVEQGNVFGCQFHPEKSGEAGLNILRSFCKL